MKKNFRTLILTCVLGTATAVLTVAAAEPAFALRDPKPIASDRRIRTIVHNDNEIYKYVGHYDYQSVIEFESDEEVLTVSMGNSVTWQVVPAGNRMFIKPVAQDAMTNMTVITNKRTYHFELHAEEASGINDPNMTFVLRFIYGRGAGISVSNFIDSVPDPMLEPEKYNFNYALTGAEDISPIRIFDDGEFTYFQFRDQNAEIPAFFQVHGDGSESIINFRTRGDYIVIERVAAQFTLRHGEDVVCVFNQQRTVRGSGPYPRPLDDKKKKRSSSSSDSSRSAPAAQSQPAVDGAKPASNIKR